MIDLKKLGLVILSLGAATMAAIGAPFGSKNNKICKDNCDSLCVVPMHIQYRQTLTYASKKHEFDVTVVDNIIHGTDAAKLDSVIYQYLRHYQLLSYSPYSYPFYSLKYNPTRYLEFYSFKFGLDELKYSVYIDEEQHLIHISTNDNSSTLVTRIFNVSIEDMHIITNILSKTEVEKPKNNLIIDEIPQITEDGPIFTDYLYREVGENVSEVLYKGEITNIYLLDPMKNDGEKCCNQFSIIERIDSVSPNLNGIFNSLLSVGSNFSQTNVVKNATFLPDYACVYYYEGRTVYVLVALYCDDIRVYDGSNYMTFDISPSHQDFVNFAMYSFPSDKFLLKYLNHRSL